MKRTTILLGVTFVAIITGLAGCGASQPTNSTTATQNTSTPAHTKRQRVKQLLKNAREKSTNNPKPAYTRPPVPYKKEPKDTYTVANLRSSQQTFPLFRGATSVWEAGSVPEDNKENYAPLLVFTMNKTENNAFIGTWVENSESAAVSKKYDQQYPCPRNITNLKITSISGQSGFVHFTSSSGVKGIFNLATHKWSFSNTATKTVSNVKDTTKSNPTLVTVIILKF